MERSSISVFGLCDCFGFRNHFHVELLDMLILKMVHYFMTENENLKIIPHFQLWSTVYAIVYDENSDFQDQSLLLWFVDGDTTCKAEWKLQSLQLKRINTSSFFASIHPPFLHSQSILQ
jgi:hypothetical protein